MRYYLILLVVSVVFNLLIVTPIKAQDQLKTALLINLQDNIRTGQSVTINIQTLDDYLQEAIAKSGKLHIAKEEYKLAIINYENQKKNMLPKVGIKYEELDGSTTGEDFKGKGSTLEMQYDLLGSYFKKFKQSKLQKEIAKLKHDQVLLELLNDSEKAYFVWAEAKIRNQKITELVKIFNEAKNVVQERFNKQMARDIDWLETKILVREATSKLKESENDLMLAEISMRQLIDDYSSSVFSLNTIGECSELELNQIDLIGLALVNRTDIMLNRLMEKVNKYNKEIAKADGGFKIVLDGFFGRRAENFVSESLDYDDEYYMGITCKLPLGGSTVETQVIDQDTVPSAGQTTSTRFTSKSVKLNFFDNKFNLSKLEGLIKYYKSIEESENIKKTAFFEITKTSIEVMTKYEQFEIAKDKLKLAKQKFEFQKMKLEANESTVNDYLKEGIALFEAENSYTKSISAYYTSVSSLNKSLGLPGFFNPENGTANNDYKRTFLKQETSKSNWFLSVLPFINYSYCADSYYPKQRYEDIKFIKKDNAFSPWISFGDRYVDPLEQQEQDSNLSNTWWNLLSKKGEQK